MAVPSGDISVESDRDGPRRLVEIDGLPPTTIALACRPQSEDVRRIGCIARAVNITPIESRVRSEPASTTAATYGDSDNVPPSP